jgi:hypothetical protein
VKDARRAVVAFLAIVAGIAATFVGVIAAGSRRSPWHSGVFVLWVVVLAIAAGLALVAAVPDFAEWLGGLAHSMTSATRRPRRLITDRWHYSSDGMQHPASVAVQELGLPGTGYRLQPGDRPAWTRFVFLVPCSPIASDADGGQLWASFKAFLAPLTGFVVGPPYAAGPDMAWVQWSTNRASAIDAILAPDAQGDGLGAARLELPDSQPRLGRDPRFAILIVHIERTRKDSRALRSQAPPSWEDRIAQGLGLASAFAGLMSEDVGLKTYADPPIHVAVRLEPREDMAEMIDIAGMEQLPGRPNGRQAIGYFTSGRDGVPARQAAQRMVTDVLRYALSVQL